MLYLATREVTPDMFDGSMSVLKRHELMKRLTNAFADECTKAFPDIAIVNRLEGLYALVLELPDVDVETLAERIGSALKCEMQMNHDEAITVPKSTPVA